MKLDAISLTSPSMRIWVVLAVLCLPESPLSHLNTLSSIFKQGPLKLGVENRISFAG